MPHNKEIARVFFKLGCFAFGGPAAHTAMMQDELVEKRKWMTNERFLDLMGITNLIPGPNSTELAMHCGRERGGVIGQILATVCFIFPAVFLTGILAYLYVHYGTKPEVKAFFVGLTPAVFAIVAGAILKLGKKAVKSWQLGVLGLVTLAMIFSGQVNEIAALFITGLIGVVVFTKFNTAKSSAILPILSVGIFSTTAIKTFLTFLKIGAILYGSGYVLIEYLNVEFVKTGILSGKEINDAIAIGQFTPGPVLSTATFVGYQIAGFWGGVLATLGIFLPSFLFVLLLNPLIDKMKQSKILNSFLSAVNVASLALMVTALVSIGKEIIIDWRPIVLTILALGLVFLTKKVSSIGVVVICVVLGYGLSLI